MTDRALITIRVHPGASRAKVAGLTPEPGQNPVLGVWVHQRAVDGRATEAALAAVAEALGVRRSSVRLVTGARARVKIIEVGDPPADLAERLARCST
jgi:uncharacterized protein YggU (UPF0235/DUF167 family)